MKREDLEDLAKEVVDALVEVHRSLGPGLLESTYEVAMAHELFLRDIPFQRQLPEPVQYKGVNLDCGYRIDLLVADSIILELKSVEQVLPVHEAQILTYLRLTAKPLGFLINFNTRLIKDGIKRYANFDILPVINS